MVREAEATTDIEALRRRLRAGTLSQELLKPGKDVVLRSGERELTRDDLQRGEPVAARGQVRFVVAPPGRIVRLDATPALALEGVHEAGFYWREGMTLPPLTSGAERLGYLLVSAPDEDELEARTERALQALDVEIGRASCRERV